MLFMCFVFFRHKGTNPQQVEVMVEAMKTEPTIAKGFTKMAKDKVQDFWLKIAESLNDKGPPFKKSTEWKKVNILKLFLMFLC